MSKNYEADFGHICRTVGVIAAQLVMEKYEEVKQLKAALLKRYVDSETHNNVRAYMLLEILFRSDFVRTYWPHMITPTDRDIRNTFYSHCSPVARYTANGWGFDKTFNPGTDSGSVKPMLVHGFSIFKEVSQSDQGWAPFSMGVGSKDNTILARPALRMLENPTCVKDLTLSVSLISPTRCATASCVGYIINTPIWNLFALAPKDIQFPNDEMMKAKNEGTITAGIQARENNLSLFDAMKAYPTPNELVTKTTGTGGESNYNELILVGTAPPFNTKIQVTGIFVKVAHKGGKLCLVDMSLLDLDESTNKQMRFYHDNKVVDSIKACAKTNNLPIVAVIDTQMTDRATDHEFDTTFAELRTVTNWV